MRVALVIERFEPTGGMENVAWHVAHGLARAGDEVHVIARCAADMNAVSAHRVRVPAGWQPLRLAVFGARAAQLAASLDFDVVHAFSRTPRQDIYRAGGGSHADYLQRMQHTYGRVGAGLRRLTPRHALLLGIERRIFSDAAQLVQCGSGMVRDEIAARFGVPPTRLHVIHNGVDFVKFRPGKAPHRERATHASLPGTTGPVWLFAGSGWRRKGLDTAMRALAATEREDSRLWVAGGDSPDRWRRLARRLGVAARVDFLGSRVDLECVYRAANALILPSRYDAFANVCLEAAASGLPVVTCRSNGSSELLAKAGIVLDDAEDAGGFAQALDRLTDASLREELAAKARALALELGWDRHVEQLRALYARVRS